MTQKTKDLATRFSFLRHGWETFSGVRVAQTLDFCVMVGRLSVRNPTKSLPTMPQKTKD
jgi:hypothetical protein